ncbi:MAG: tRNA pseudouridine(55) synthase TruB [Bacteroidales bacterium]|nr:tRNA pseudouridine(55) synthase TruB [Bacteroidales bacterium]
MSFLVPRCGQVLSRDIARYPEGIVLPVDKPYRWTSADVIRKLKYAAIRHFGKKNLKVGHAGTLDPLATGVLLVCIGNACKQAQQLQDHDKEYIARIRFGATTPSYDLEKEVDRQFPYNHITADTVRAALPAFLGEQEQVAPLFSAKSVDGVRAYELARKLYRSGRSAELDAAALENLHRNRICISELELLDFIPAGNVIGPRVVRDYGESLPSGTNASLRIHVADTSALGLPEAVIRIACSKGTYIRAFARDLGEALESGGHLSGLIRSRSGDFSVGDTLSIPEALALFPVSRPAPSGV